MLNGRWRWIVCALLFSATTVNYMDRQVLSLTKEFLDLRFGWSKADFGLVNSVFQGSYCVGLLFFGWFIDRRGVKIGYAISMAGWSLAAMLHALVGLIPAGSAAAAVWAFGACRVLLGLAEAGNFPAAVKGTALWFPARERAFATSLFNSGANVGALLAPALVPFVALRWGWGTAFIAAGLTGLGWLAAWQALYDAPERHPGVTREELDHILSDPADGQPARPVAWPLLLRRRQVWAVIAAKFLTDPVWWFFLIWLPDYFKTARGLDIARSWPLLVAIYGMITTLSVFGGWITGRLAASGWSVTAARKTGMLLFALCVLPIYFVARVGDWPAVLLIGLAGAAHQAWSANVYATISDMFPKRAVASVAGISGMAGSLGGMLFPIATGRLLDRCRAAGDEPRGYALLLSFCAFAYVAAFAANHLLAPRYEPVALSA